MTDLLSLKRIKRDLVNLSKGEGVAGCGVKPREDNVRIWDACFELHISSWKITQKWFKLHFIIHFPDDYPSTAPSLGFSSKFPFEAGVSFVEDDKRKALYGKYCICLNVLGNFTAAHPDWKDHKYSGWASGLDIAQVLHQTQTVIIDNLERANLHQIESFLRETTRFEEENKLMIDEIVINYPAETPPIVKTIRNPYLRRLQKLVVTVKRPLSLPTSNTKKNSSLGGGRKIEASITYPAYSLTSPSTFVETTESSMSSNDPVDVSDLKIPTNIKKMCSEFMSKLSDQTLRRDFKSILKQFVADDEIQCWYTKCNYIGNIMGYGVRVTWDKKKKYQLHTDGSLISYQAFNLVATGSVTKAENFKYFLPAWINTDHVKDPRWLRYTENSLRILWNDTETRIHGKEEVQKDETMAMCCYVESIYTRLINTLIVQCVKVTVQERSTCDVIVQCIVNLWRTLYFFIYEHKPTKDFLTQSLGESVNSFIAEDNCRRKDWCPDVGRLVTQSTLFVESKEKWRSFLDACEVESALRRCRWLQEKEVNMNLHDTYENTQVGRENILFQIMLKNIVFTMDVKSIANEMDLSNCQLPEKVSLLMLEWNKARAKMTRPESGWRDYYDLLHQYGLSEKVHREITGSDETILKYLVDKDNRSKELGGYHYDPSKQRKNSSSSSKLVVSRGTSNNSSTSTTSNNSDSDKYRNSSRNYNGKQKLDVKSGGRQGNSNIDKHGNGSNYTQHRNQSNGGGGSRRNSQKLNPTVHR